VKKYTSELLKVIITFYDATQLYLRARKALLIVGKERTNR